MKRVGKVSYGALQYGLGAAAVVAVLLPIGMHNYLLFHTLVEGLSIAISCGMFMVAWHTRHYTDNDFLLFISCACAMTGAVDLLHTLTYQGMGVIAGTGANTATQLWIGARMLQSVSLCIAPFFLYRRVTPYFLLTGCFLAAAGVVASIFLFDLFPVCYSETDGLTLFKELSELGIIGLFTVAFFTLRHNRRLIDRRTYYPLVGSLVAAVFAEAAFAMYVSPFDGANFLGHLLKMVAFFLLYRAVIVGTLEQPYGVLFRNLQQTNEKLHSSEEHFRRLFELSGVGKVEVDPVDGKFTRVNQRMAEITGYTAGELQNMGLYELTHPADREHVGKILADVFNGERNIWTTENRCIRKDGADIWVNVFGSVVRGGGEQVRHYIADVVDVTESRAVRESLMVSERRYALAQQAANIGTWEWDVSGGTLIGSEQIEPIFGLGRGTLDGTIESFIAAVHPDDRTLFSGVLEKCLSDGKDFTVEHRIVFPDGTVRWVRERAMLVYGNNREPEKMVGVVIDITRQIAKRRELESKVALQESALADTKQFIVQIHDEKQKTEQKLEQRQQALEAVYAIITSSTSSLQKICEEVVGHIATILDVQSVAFYQLPAAGGALYVHYPESVELHKRPCSACEQVQKRKKTSQYNGDLSTWFPDSSCLGSDDYHAHIAVPVLTYRNDLAGIICVMRTRDQRFSEYEEHLVEIFARYVAYEITRRQLQSEMLQSREMHLLGQLTSGVAHEVRNPLNALMAISEALFKKIGNDEKYSQYMEHIRNQIKRLSRLMEDLLALGRPIRADNFIAADIASLVREVVNDWIRFEPESRRRLITVDVPEGLSGTIRVDVIKIQQVLINLLDNALQHGDLEGSIVVTLNNNDSETVKIAVRDTGSGFDQDKGSQLFEPFFTTRKSGTGLGLSIVKNTVEHHGGTITMFNNQPPPGVTVEMVLPLYRHDG